jgi:hypothetical protein
MLAPPMAPDAGIAALCNSMPYDWARDLAAAANEHVNATKYVVHRRALADRHGMHMSRLPACLQAREAR